MFNVRTFLGWVTGSEDLVAALALRSDDACMDASRPTSAARPLSLAPAAVEVTPLPRRRDAPAFPAGARIVSRNLGEYLRRWSRRPPAGPSSPSATSGARGVPSPTLRRLTR